jgi:hypothetical protein
MSWVLASGFDDEIGCKDNDLYAGYYYAELNYGKSLGNLPFGTKLRITYNGKSIIASKGDIGNGGP